MGIKGKLRKQLNELDLGTYKKFAQDTEGIQWLIKMTLIKMI